MDLKGKLLLATPNLVDSNFAKTVIAVVHHGNEGTTGLVLNTPVDTKNRQDIKAAWANAFGQQVEFKMDRLYIGGPMPCGLMVVHSDARFSENEILPGVYVTSNKQSLSEIVLQRDSPYRCFAGYSGWVEGQLEYEINHGGWYICENSYEVMFHDGEPKQFWECQLKKWTESLLSRSLNLNIKHIPPDPSVN